MNGPALELLGFWPGRFRFPELLVMLATGHDPDPAEVTDAVLDGLVAARDEIGTAEDLIDDGRFDAAAYLLEHYPGFGRRDIDRLRDRMDGKRTEIRHGLRQRLTELGRRADAAGVTPPPMDTVLAAAERDWPTAGRELKEKIDQVDQEIEERGAALLDGEPSDTVRVLTRLGQLRAAAHVRDLGDPAVPPEAVVSAPPLPSFPAEDMLDWHLKPNKPAPPSFRSHSIGVDAQRLLQDFSNLGDEDAARSFLESLARFLGAPAPSPPRRVGDGYLGRIPNALTDSRLAGLIPSPLLQVHLCPPSSTEPPEQPGLPCHMAVGPGLEGRPGRGNAAVLELPLLLRLAACPPGGRTVNLLRMLGPQWTLDAFNAGNVSQFEKTLGGDSWSALCWIADLAGLGGSIAAAVLSFESGDQISLLYTMLQYLAEGPDRLEALSSWRHDVPLAARIEKTMLQPVEGSVAAVVTFWAALATAVPGEEVTLADLVTATLQHDAPEGVEDTLRRGVAELVRHPSLAAPAHDLVLRESGAAIGLQDRAPARLLELLARPAEPPAITDDTWSLYRYALSPAWGTDAPAALRDGWPHRPDNLTTGCDVVSVLEEMRPAFVSTHPQVELVIDTPASASTVVGAPALRAILYELLANAAEAMADRGDIEVNVRSEAGDIVLRVADSGPGIPEEFVHTHHIYRAGVTSYEMGRGQGLHIVHVLVQAVGGTIQETRRNEHPLTNGARFDISLPEARP